MGLDDSVRWIKKVAQTGAVLSIVSGAPASAQEQKSAPEEPRKEKLEKEPPFTDRGIPSPQYYFKIDEFVAATEGTSEERKKLAEEVFAYVLEHGTTEYASKEKLFPLTLVGEPLAIRVLVFPGRYKEMRIIIFKAGETPIALIDVGITGTPSEHQLPIQEKGITRPQGFIIQGESELANRIYLGILRQIISKF